MNTFLYLLEMEHEDLPWYPLPLPTLLYSMYPLETPHENGRLRDYGVIPGIEMYRYAKEGRASASVVEGGNEVRIESLVCDIW